MLFVVVPRLGTEFLPYMDEGVIWVRANFPEGTSLEQTASTGDSRDRPGVPDINSIRVRAGKQRGTDPFPPSRMEMMIGPKPRDQWKQFRTKTGAGRRAGQAAPREFPPRASTSRSRSSTA